MSVDELKNSWSAIADIGGKDAVFREAIATGILQLSSSGIEAVKGRSKKGDVREISTIASIQAVKETPRILPHCHTIPIEGCSVEWQIEGCNLRCTVTVRTHWRTGVEMEALSAVSVAALTVYDMCKAIDKGMSIENIRLLEKAGGKSGAWLRDEQNSNTVEDSIT